MWFVTEVSRVWFAFFEKGLQIQFANVSAQDCSERFFDTTLQRKRKCVFRTPTHHKNAALNVFRQKNKKSL